MARRSTQSTRMPSLSLLASFITSSLAAPLAARNSSCFPPADSVASSIEFAACPQELGVPESLLCATYSVPIDWDEPNGEHFDLGLVKLPAAPSNSTSKVGSLFVNPGGPGQSAAGLVATVAKGDVVPEVLMASFDFIGLDPRGVGFSGQIKCDPEILSERVSLFPKTQEEYDVLVDKNKRLGASCRELTGPLLEHVDTISAAKDHEAVRIALGNEPMNFLGLSYGSQLGAQYAALFPDNIRTMALDGITQHSQGQAENILVESSSYAASLQLFFEWASTDDSSPLEGQDMEAFWTSLLADATSSPLKAAGCDGKKCRKDVTAEEILFKAQPSMASATGDVNRDDSWGHLASALFNASQGDATALSASSADNITMSSIAIGCLDWTSTQTFAESIQKQAMAEVYTPLTRGASQTWMIQHQCIGWPVAVVNPPTKLDIKTEATIVMAASTTDPETGYPWAIGMLEEMDNRVLVTRKGAGHTSFRLGGETMEVMGKYLITAEVPEEGLFLDS